MTGRYKAYAEYKDSPIDWLDKIPAHWTTKKLKHLGEAIIGLTYSPNEVVDGSDSNATLVLRSSNVQGQKITLNDNVFVNKEIPEKLTTRLNDILICSRNGSRALIGKNALIDKDSVGMSFGAFMTIYRSKHNTYLSHVMNSKLFEYQSGSFLTSTINQLTTGNLNSFEIPFPSEKERECIANFLDHETAKIDTLISKQEKLIELLKEKRQAVISHAVTKGLNPDAPMKDSGVEWLGEVPEHWSVIRLRFLCDITTGSRDTQDAKDDGQYPFFVRSERVQAIDTYSFDGEGVMTSGDGAGVGKIYHHFIGKCEIHQRVYLFHKFKQITPRYFYHFLKQNLEPVALAQSAKSTVDSLRLPILQEFNMCFGDEVEQQEICNYVDSLSEQFDLLIDKAENAITLMKERKTALISAAVTGKIDVRDWDTQGVQG
ncbi:restriction endonuclease subunit S [Vibrio alginolyticus]